MLLAIISLLTGLIISAVAIYYSVVGLTAIFAAAAIPIIVMGVSLEVAKLVATVWLKQNWKTAPKLIRSYLVVAVLLLMLITSMGIFGFLSKAHLDQNMVSGDVVDRVAILDEKIKTQKDNMDAARKALKQMDESVDQVMSRSNDEKGADKAVQLRRSQAKERSRLQAEISTAQADVTKLQAERTPIATELRKVEAEVGPIKYIASFIYGSAEQNVLEKAVTWLIILIVVVFDPLAVILLLASQYSIAKIKGEPQDESEGVEPDPIAKTKLTDKISNTIFNIRQSWSDAKTKIKGSFFTPVKELPVEAKKVEDAVDEEIINLDEINLELAAAGVEAQELFEVLPEAVQVEPETAALTPEQMKKMLERFVEVVRPKEELIPVPAPIQGFDVPRTNATAQAMIESLALPDVEVIENVAQIEYTPVSVEVEVLDAELQDEDLPFGNDLDAWNKMIEAAEAEVDKANKEKEAIASSYSMDERPGDYVAQPTTAGFTEVIEPSVGFNYVQNEEQAESNLWQETRQIVEAEQIEHISQQDYQSKVKDAIVKRLVQNVEEGRIRIDEMTSEEALAVEEYLTRNQ